MSYKDATRTRIKNAVYNAEPNKGRSFAHWLDNGWFILIRKTRVELHWSASYESGKNKSKHIYSGPRTRETCDQINRALGL